MKKYIIEGRQVNSESQADGYTFWEPIDIENIEADSPAEALGEFLNWLKDYPGYTVYEDYQTSNEFGNPYIAEEPGDGSQLDYQAIEYDEI